MDMNGSADRDGEGLDCDRAGVDGGSGNDHEVTNRRRWDCNAVANQEMG